MHTFLQLNNNTNTVGKSFLFYQIVTPINLAIPFHTNTPAHRGACKKKSMFNL